MKDIKKGDKVKVKNLDSVDTIAGINESKTYTVEYVKDLFFGKKLIGLVGIKFSDVYLDQCVLVEEFEIGETVKITDALFNLRGHIGHIGKIIKIFPQYQNKYRYLVSCDHKEGGCNVEKYVPSGFVLQFQEKMDITINRMGEFYVTDTSSHPNQCGTVGRRKYKYTVSVTGTNENLDDKGFLMDNQVIKSYFDERYEGKQMKCDSCENMAIAAVEFIKNCCPDTVKRIYVQLWGAEVSYIEAEWKK